MTKFVLLHHGDEETSYALFEVRLARSELSSLLPASDDMKIKLIPLALQPRSIGAVRRTSMSPSRIKEF